MLHEFITTNRLEILARARAKVKTRAFPRPTEDELKNGIPLFLDQLVVALNLSTANTANTDAIGASATLHGGDLLRMGFTIAQVVHDYGDICQAVTELAEATDAPITVDEFRMLNKCLDDAIAQAVTEYARLRERSRKDQATERSGALAHELRNRLNAAMLAFAALKTGRVGIDGSTGKVLDRNLRGLRDLIDGSLTEVRLDSGLHNRERVSVSELIDEIEVDASLEAAARGIGLTVAPVDRGLEVDVDRAILTAAVNNLLHNAFKFSHAKGQVSLKTSATTSQVMFDVEDECGGLPEGDVMDLFLPFTQRGRDRTGLGLGLSISQRGIVANGGEVLVRDLPGKGCIFTIALPRHG